MGNSRFAQLNLKTPGCKAEAEAETGSSQTKWKEIHADCAPLVQGRPSHSPQKNGRQECPRSFATMDAKKKLPLEASTFVLITWNEGML